MPVIGRKPGQVAGAPGIAPGPRPTAGSTPSSGIRPGIGPGPIGGGLSGTIRPGASTPPPGGGGSPGSSPGSSGTSSSSSSQSGGSSSSPSSSSSGGSSSSDGSGANLPPPPGLPTINLPALPSFPSLTSLNKPAWYHGLRPASSLAATIRDGWFTFLGDLSQYPYNQVLRTQFAIAAGLTINGAEPPAGWWIGAALFGPTDAKGNVEVNFNAPILWGNFGAGAGNFAADGSGSWVVNQPEPSGIPANYSIDQYYYVVISIWPPGSKGAGPPVGTYMNLQPIYGQILASQGISFPIVNLVTGWEAKGKLVDTDGNPVANRSLYATAYNQTGETVGYVTVTTGADGTFDKVWTILPEPELVTILGLLYTDSSMSVELGQANGETTSTGLVHDFGTSTVVVNADGSITPHDSSGSGQHQHHGRMP